MSLMKSNAFVIRMLVLEGDPDGIRVIDRSNWTGKAVVFPRSLFQNVRKLAEFGKPGVYVLSNRTDEGELPTLYIGEGDPVAPRIEEHNAKKDFWTWGVFFTSSDASLNKVHIQYLESELVRLAKEANRVSLDNGNTPQKPSLSPADEAEASGFLDNMLGIFPLIGIHAFEQAPTHKKAEKLFFLSGKGIAGRGFETSSGFVVLKDATACLNHAPSLNKSSVERRAALRKSSVLVEDGGVLKLTQDYVFGSPSAAAEALLATPINGRDVWKDEKGQSLNMLAEMAAIQSKAAPQ